MLPPSGVSDIKASKTGVFYQFCLVFTSKFNDEPEIL